MMNMGKIPLGIVDFCSYEKSLPALSFCAFTPILRKSLWEGSLA